MLAPSTEAQNFGGVHERADAHDFFPKARHIRLPHSCLLLLENMDVDYNKRSTEGAFGEALLGY